MVAHLTDEQRADRRRKGLSGESDSRIPDLTFVANGREHVLAQDGVRGEGPDAVVDIRSPHDETSEKLPFYASIGVKEVIVCDRDSKAPEIFRLAGPQYVALQADDGLVSGTMAIRLRRVEGMPTRLRIEDAADSSRGVHV